MNDRFKFRAWWKPNYRKPIMLYDVEKTYDFMRGEPESICADCFGDVLEDEDYIVMQCTGLKDKNGKLIYEGDIVNGSCGVYWGKMIVEYNVAGFVLNKNGKYLNFLEGDNYIEVIGNIYENKELLEELNAI
jgi:uncharacterized phage protein (TIGR01671 family)